LNFCDWKILKGIEIKYLLLKKDIDKQYNTIIEKISYWTSITIYWLILKTIESFNSFQ